MHPYLSSSLWFSFKKITPKLELRTNRLFFKMSCCVIRRRTKSKVSSLFCDVLWAIFAAREHRFSFIGRYMMWLKNALLSCDRLTNNFLNSYYLRLLTFSPKSAILVILAKNLNFEKQFFISRLCFMFHKRNA